jgi:hypothetical protein
MHAAANLLTVFASLRAAPAQAPGSAPIAVAA